MSEREVGTLVLLAAGLAVLGATAWARRGGSYRARSWMYNPPPPSHSLHDERVVIFGGPTSGFGLLAFGGILLPPESFGGLVPEEVAGLASLAGVALLPLLLVPLAWWVLGFIRIPDAFYPRWAREVLDDRRRYPQISPDQPPHPKDRPGPDPG